MKEEKRCNKCKEPKTLDCYYTKGRDNGNVRYQAQCKKCVSAGKKKEYKQKKRTKIVSNISCTVSFLDVLTEQNRKQIYSKVLEL